MTFEDTQWGLLVIRSLKFSDNVSTSMSSYILVVLYISNCCDTGVGLSENQKVGRSLKCSLFTKHALYIT